MSDSLLSFPPGFMWGASTAAHQIEGNNVNSDWWARERVLNDWITEPSGDAADSYHRYAEEVALLADAGLNTYRFSVEWARIEPEPGRFSRALVDHYRRMVAACHERGLTPVVTAQHFTLPQWLAEAGGWVAEEAVDRFARYTEAILPILADGVEWVCTINEPNIVAIMNRTDLTDRPPAGLPAPDPGISDALVRAHGRAAEVLRSLPAVKVGWSVATQDVQAVPGSEDRADDYRRTREDVFLETARGDDWIGVQAYTRTLVGPDGPRPVDDGVEVTLTGWEYYPPALGHGVRNAWQLTGGVPVMVTENGIATADDARRVDYTSGALTGLHEAIADGVTVLGYLHWSALDNYEWGSYAPTFGLVQVDRTTFVRTPRPSLGWLGRVAKANALATGPAAP